MFIKPNPQGKPKHTQVPQCSTHLCGPQQRQRLPQGPPGYRQPPGPLPSALQTVGNRAGATALQCVQMGSPYSAVLPCPAPPGRAHHMHDGLVDAGIFRKQKPLAQWLLLCLQKRVAIHTENYSFYACGFGIWTRSGFVLETLYHSWKLRLLSLPHHQMHRRLRERKALCSLLAKCKSHIRDVAIIWTSILSGNNYASRRKLRKSAVHKIRHPDPNEGDNIPLRFGPAGPETLGVEKAGFARSFN